MNTAINLFFLAPGSLLLISSVLIVKLPFPVCQTRDNLLSFSVGVEVIGDKSCELLRKHLKSYLQTHPHWENVADLHFSESSNPSLPLHPKDFHCWLVSTSSPTLGQPFGITFWDNLPIFPPSIHTKSQTPTWALSLEKFSQMAGTWPEGPGTAAAPDLFSSMGRKLVKKPRQGTLCLRLSLKSPYYSYKSLYFKMEISMVCFFFTREIFLSWLIFFFGFLSWLKSKEMSWNLYF